MRPGAGRPITFIAVANDKAITENSLAWPTWEWLFSTRRQNAGRRPPGPAGVARGLPIILNLLLTGGRVLLRRDPPCLTCRARFESRVFALPACGWPAASAANLPPGPG